MPSLPIEWFVESWTCGGPTSACGFGNYDNGEGCSLCPADPPNDPIVLGCVGNFLSADFNSYDKWLDVSFDAGIHEAFSGEAHIRWIDAADDEGEGDFSWTYDPSSSSFRFYVDGVPDDTQELRIEVWEFRDACGYPFESENPVRISSVGDGFDIDCGN